MRVARIGFVAAMLLGACGVANATSYILNGTGNTPGTAQPLVYLDDVTVNSSPAVPAGSPRTDDWYFSITQPLYIKYGQVSFSNVSDFRVELFDPTNLLTAIFDSDTCVGCILNKTVTIPYTLLNSGTFLLRLSLTGGNIPGSYTANFQVVPLPAAAWLLLSGVAGLGAMARRRKVAAEA